MGSQASELGENRSRRRGATRWSSLCRSRACSAPKFRDVLGDRCCVFLVVFLAVLSLGKLDKNGITASQPLCLYIDRADGPAGKAAGGQAAGGRAGRTLFKP